MLVNFPYTELDTYVGQLISDGIELYLIQWDLGITNVCITKSSA